MAAQTLDDVLSFVAETLKKDEKQVYRLSDYKAGLHYHEGDLHGLEGLEVNARSGLGPAWLKIARLIKEPSPKFPLRTGSDLVAEDELIINDKWVVIPDDPHAEPTLRTSIRLSIPLADAKKLVKSNRMDRDDHGEVNAVGRVMATVQLERFPEVGLLYDRWMAKGWTPWAVRERPRRKSIAFYDELFKVNAAITGRDANLEVIMGVGQVRGTILDHPVDHPLVEYRAELFVDPRNGDISVRGKDDNCDIFSLPAEDGAGGAAVMTEARENWSRLPDSCEISPFERLHFEPVLQAAAVHLGSSGKFVSLKAPRALSSVEAGFCVFDSWILLVRPTSLKPLLSDIAAMQDELRRTDTLEPLIALMDNPNSAECLLQGMVDRVADLLKAAAATVMVHGNGSAGGDTIQVSVAPYFPKVSNADQEKIIRLLERKETKGLVVQGPPGTGKSHSIANIMCHALASGWRVLVTAHSDGPLQVLKGMLPPELRNLAINLSAAEETEVSQLEESVKAIAAIATRVDDQTRHVRQIQNTEERVLQNRVRLVEINEAFLQWARENLDYHETYSGRLTAAALAEQIVKESQSNRWFDDIVPLTNLVPPLKETDVGRIRAIRAKLGEDLIAYEWRLPEQVVIPLEEEITRVHAALLEGVRLGKTEPPVPVRHLAGISNGVDLARDMRSKLEHLLKICEAFNTSPWLDAWREDLKIGHDEQRIAPAIEELIELMSLFAAKERGFVVNQVVVPHQPPGLKQAAEKASHSDKAYSRLPFFKPQPDMIQALEAVRVRGQKPTREDWTLVADYLGWLDGLVVLANRWNALAAMFGFQLCATEPFAALAWFRGAIQSLKLANTLDSTMETLLPASEKLSSVSISAADVRTSKDSIEATATLIRNWLTSIDHRCLEFEVAWATGRHAAMTRAIEPYTGPSSEEFRTIVSDLGCEAHGVPKMGERWKSALADHAIAVTKRDMGLEMEALAEKLANAGAVKWAERIKSVPHITNTELANQDPVLPDSWVAAWVWSAWKGKLEATRSLSRIRKLLAEKADIEIEIAKLMNSIVVLRTELQLSRLSKPLLSKLTLFQGAVQRMGAGTGVRAARLRREAKKLAAECYEAVPCWIMPVRKVAETQPPKLGIFDLVIIDEASQCGPEAIPVMMRAKKALIVGDDKQVSPTSFMSEEAYAHLHARFLAGSPYRAALSPGSSMYDLASAMFAGHNVRLREHFRCVEPVIRFSMRFYGQDSGTSLVPLRIPKPSERLDPPIIDIHVPHGFARGQTNRAEAVVIAAEIGRLAEDPAYAGKTIGVISLSGSDQAALIEREIMERLGTDVFSRFELLISDSSGFQGKERSIVFLSMVDAPNRRTAARVQDIYAQRYNVALSRARDRMYLVRSITLENTRNAKDLRRQAIEHFSDPMPTEVARKQATEDLIEKCDSGFERDVLRMLLRDGFDANPQVPAAGYKIDIVVDGDEDRRLAIELDGDVYHPPEQYAKDMERQQQLERIGFKFWRCWWSEWILDPEACYADLRARLEGLGVRPIVGTRKPRSSYAVKFIADEEGILYTAEEYAARSAEAESYEAPVDAGAESIDAEFSESGVAWRSLPAHRAYSQVLALPRTATQHDALRPGDMVVIQASDVSGDGDCRTRNLQLVAGELDEMQSGRIGVGSVLGRLLANAFIDDCFNAFVDGREITVTIVAVRKAT